MPTLITALPRPHLGAISRRRPIGGDTSFVCFSCHALLRYQCDSSDQKLLTTCWAQRTALLLRLLPRAAFCGFKLYKTRKLERHTRLHSTTGQASNETFTPSSLSSAA